MNIDSSSYVSQLASRSAQTQATSSNQFTSDTFFQLLAAQLQYQDPMESMDNTQMILQMAQFATIEQLNNLNNQFAVFMEMSTIQDGAALVGKEVRIGLDDETTIVGIVDKVGFSSSGTLLQIDGKYYEAWRIIEIGQPSTEAPPSVEGGTEETPDVDETPNVEETPDVDETPNVEETPGVDETPNVETNPDVEETPNQNTEA